METSAIIKDLTIIVVIASLVSITFSVLRLPVLLGYLLSGMLIGPSAFGMGMVTDIPLIDDLSELGVAFLMFYIGLEFDLDKLKRILGPSVLGVFLQTLCMFFLGVMSAPLLGWSQVDGLFLGALFAISSTMVAIPVLQSQGDLKANYGQLAVGVLILEDILAILVLVILTGVGVTGKFAWSDAWQVVFLVGVFVVMVYFTGKLIAPWLLRVIKRYGSEEMVTVVSVGLLLGIGLLAEHFHFSIALGAFLAGSVLSQSELSAQIEMAIEPLRSLFSAIFFVTIGMKIDPMMLKEYWLSIVLMSVLVAVGKVGSVMLGLFLSGQKPSASFRASVCKAQLGEFSFVIASLGMQYGLVNSGMMALAAGVALITITVTPVLSKNSVKVYEWLTGRTPQGMKEMAGLYANFLVSMKRELGKNDLLRLLQRPLVQILGYFLLFNGVLIGTFLSSKYLDGWIEVSMSLHYVKIIVWVVGAFVSLPFLIAIVRNLEVVVLLVTEAVWSTRTISLFKQGNMRNTISTGILCLVLIVLGGVYLSVAASFLPSGVALFAFLGLVVVLSILFWRHIVKVNSRLEQLFIQSFNRDFKSDQGNKRQLVLTDFRLKNPWPLKLWDINVKKEMGVCGRRIKELGLREKTGVSIVGVTRGNYALYEPDPEMVLLPEDHLIIIGREEECLKAQELLTKAVDRSMKMEEGEDGEFLIDQVFISAESGFANSTIADSGIRLKYKITVVGIQRGEKRIFTPKPEEILKVDDVLVVTGTRGRVECFKRAAEGAGDAM